MVLLLLGLACAPSGSLGAARQAVEGGRPGRAIELYRIALDRDARSGEAREGLIRALLMRARTRRSVGDLVGALRDADRAVRESPYELEAVHLQGSLRLQLGQARGSIATDLEGVVRDRPKALKLRLLLAQIYLEIGEIPSALEHLLRASRLAPERAEIRVQLATALLRADNRERARAELLAALQREPEHPTAQLLMARLHRLEGKNRQARDLLERAVETHPTNPKLRAALDALDQPGSAQGQGEKSQ